jgi:hypothetical protein
MAWLITLSIVDRLSAAGLLRLVDPELRKYVKRKAAIGRRMPRQQWGTPAGNLEVAEPHTIPQPSELR